MAAEDGGPAPVEPVVTEAPAREGWKQRIYVPTLLAGIVGGGAGLLSKRRHAFGAANLAATYASNLAIVTGCYCSTREFVRETRDSDSDDLVNSVIGGFASGALLGRLQGGPVGAVRYSVLFAIAGTALDYATLQLKPIVRSYWDSMSSTESGKKNSDGSSRWSMPEWSPIQVLDEEALAAKRAKEQQLHAERIGGKLNKEDSQRS